MSPDGQSGPARPPLVALDDEHREIVRLVREFDDLLGRGGSADQIVDLFAVLLANIRSHFADEERLMDDTGYAGYPSHKAAHDSLLDELNGAMIDCEHGAYADRYRALSRRITDWLTEHMDRMDAPLIEAEHRRRGVA